MAANLQADPPSLLKTLEVAIKNTENVTMPLEENHYFYSNDPDFKSKTNLFLDKIKTLLTSLPGSLPASEDTFKSPFDAQDWTVSFLDATLSRVDDALSKPAINKEKQKDLTSKQEHTTQQPIEALKAHRLGKEQGFTSYMRSVLRDKPQQRFEPLMDNSNSPFIHNLQNLIEIVDVEQAMSAMSVAAAAGKPLPHPLQSMLDSLQYPDHVLNFHTKGIEKSRNLGDFDATPFTFVDTVSQLEVVAQRLCAVHEIAVDLEAHNYRSFQGFCCLMQLSTRQEDIIIDVLALRSHIGRVLAPIFANPAIIKVLHGSDGDIVWLQRDFGIYTCNLFDTGQASRVLNYPAHGLGYLLQHLVDFKADKRWQLADWRIRPLSKEAIHYARADTHYLLHCYDLIRAELSEPGLAVAPHLQIAEFPPGTNTPVDTPLGTVLERSRRICLQLYEKELVKEDSFLRLYAKIEKTFTDEQLSVFAALYDWRDKTAREEDESLGFVLSRAQLIGLSQSLPITAAEVGRVLGKGGGVVQKQVRHVLALIDEARKNTSRIVELKTKYKYTLAAELKKQLEKLEREEKHHGEANGAASQTSLQMKKRRIVHVLPDMAAAAYAAGASMPIYEMKQQQQQQEQQQQQQEEEEGPHVVDNMKDDDKEAEEETTTTKMESKVQSEVPLNSTSTPTLKPKTLEKPLNRKRSSGLICAENKVDNNCAKSKTGPSMSTATAATTVAAATNTTSYSLPKVPRVASSLLFGSLFGVSAPKNKNPINKYTMTTASATPVFGFGTIVPKLAIGADYIEPSKNSEEEENLVAEQQVRTSAPSPMTTKTAREKQADVREAMNQMRAENDQVEEGEIVCTKKRHYASPVEELEIEKEEEQGDPGRKTKTSNVEGAEGTMELDDFIPLSLSARYNVHRKKKRNQSKVQNNNNAIIGMEDRHRNEDKQGKEVQHNDKSTPVGVDYETALRTYDLGLVDPHRNSAVKKRDGPYSSDFSRGRGRGKGGREGMGDKKGGRGTNGNAPRGAGLLTKARFNPYAALDMSGLKGGKRSAVHVRSGNRSSGFSS